MGEARDGEDGDRGVQLHVEKLYGRGFEEDQVSRPHVYLAASHIRRKASHVEELLPGQFLVNIEME